MPKQCFLDFQDWPTFIDRNKQKYKNGQAWGGSPGLVVMVDNSCSEGHGFESWHRILDGHFFTYICCKIVIFV